MYVHIGSNVIMRAEDMVGVFDMETLKSTRGNLRIINLYKERGKDGDQTAIIRKDGEVIFSKVKVNTISKRLKSKKFINNIIDE